MASLTIGEKCQSLLTGKTYWVKMIKDQMVVLDSIDGSSQVLTNRENFHLFYKKVLQAEDGQSILGEDGPSPHWGRTIK